MGTTIAYIVAAAGRLYAGGVGDSRVYLLRDGDLQQLTRDHSLTQALLDAGTITIEEAATHRYKNVLYRYLGSKDGGTGTDPKEISPMPGDRYMICSDGVTDGLDSETVARILSQQSDPQHAAEAIVKAAEEGGSKDNITCIVVYVG
jgi:protein phosphatase